MIHVLTLTLVGPVGGFCQIKAIQDILARSVGLVGCRVASEFGAIVVLECDARVLQLVLTVPMAPQTTPSSSTPLPCRDTNLAGSFLRAVCELNMATQRIGRCKLPDLVYLVLAGAVAALARGYNDILRLRREAVTVRLICSLDSENGALVALVVLHVVWARMAGLGGVLVL